MKPWKNPSPLSYTPLVSNHIAPVQRTIFAGQIDAKLLRHRRLLFFFFFFFFLFLVVVFFFFCLFFLFFSSFLQSRFLLLLLQLLLLLHVLLSLSIFIFFTSVITKMNRNVLAAAVCIPITSSLFLCLSCPVLFVLSCMTYSVFGPNFFTMFPLSSFCVSFCIRGHGEILSKLNFSFVCPVMYLCLLCPSPYYFSYALATFLYVPYISSSRILSFLSECPHR